MLKILLLRPNFKIRLVYPPLGLAYIAGWLRKSNASYEIKVVDGVAEKLDSAGFAEIFSRYKPDVVGISSMDISSHQTHDISAISKQVNRNCRIIVGGAYPTGNPEKVLSDRNVDFVIIGEGEKSVTALIKSILNGDAVSHIGGLGYKKNGDLILNRNLDYVDDIDTLSFPAWDLIGLERYRISDIIPVPVLTTRGCPYNCAYCLNIFGKKVRFRSIENIAQEIKLLVNEYQVRHIVITDDIFNIDYKRTMDFCNMVISSNFDIKITIGYGLKFDFMNKKIITKLKKAGAIWIAYGLEPVSKKMNFAHNQTSNNFSVCEGLLSKRNNPAHDREIINFSACKGLFAEGVFGIGAPGITEEETMRFIRYMSQTKLHVASFINMSSYLHKNEKNAPKNTEFACNKPGYYRGVLPEKTLKRIQIKAYLIFYLNPARIWRIVVSPSACRLRIIKNAASFLKEYVKSVILP